ncbi:MAG: hypothetical protein LKF00_06075 [Olsenella sp.]|nr:hypothetical protein [Olsenella sp.]
MTEGMPARRSTAVLTTRVTLRVAICVRYTAQPTGERHADDEGAHGDEGRPREERQDAVVALGRRPGGREEPAQPDVREHRQRLCQREHEDEGHGGHRDERAQQEEVLEQALLHVRGVVHQLELARALREGLVLVGLDVGNVRRPIEAVEELVMLFSPALALLF